MAGGCLICISVLGVLEPRDTEPTIPGSSQLSVNLRTVTLVSD